MEQQPSPTDASGDAMAFYVERLADIGADSPLFAAFYDADAGVWAWRMAWISPGGRACVVEHAIPDELLRDDESEAAPDLCVAIVAGRAAAQGFCAAYADEDPALAAILDALIAGDDGDDAGVAAAAARLAALYAAGDAAEVGQCGAPTA